MTISSLQKIANNIKTLRRTGLLDPAELNKYLWPVAAIHLLDSSAGVQCVGGGHKPLGTDNTAHPSFDPINAPNAETPEGRTNLNAVKRVGVITSESVGSSEAAIGHGLQPHTRSSEPSGKGGTTPDENRSDIPCASQDVVEVEGGSSARFAGRDRGRGGRQYTAVDPIGPEGQMVRSGEQGTGTTNPGVAIAKRSEKNHGVNVDGEVSKDQDTDEGDQAVDEEPSDERVSPSTAYPKSLMVESPVWINGNGERGNKRKASNEEPHLSSSKFQRSNLPGNKTRFPWTSLSSQSGVSLLSKEQREAEHFNTLTSQFRSRWAEKLPTFDTWHSLDRFARIGTRPDQQPYEELETIMQRVVSIGTSSVQAVFARSVTAWISSPHITKSAIELPTHLKNIAGFEAGPFQNFWKAMEVSRNAKGFKDMAVLLRRKSLVNLMAAFSEVTKYVRQCSATGKLKLGNGVRASAKAREILYATLYPESDTRIRMRSCFNYDQQCASAYVKLVKHFGNLGILAMIPSKLNEGDFRSTDARLAAFVELLDLVRPELNGPRVRFYGKIVETISGGGVPDAAALQELAVWTSTRHPSYPSYPIDQVVSAPRDAVAESMFPVGGLYRSVDEKAQLETLPELEREEILMSRSELILRETQDRLISEQFRACENRAEA